MRFQPAAVPLQASHWLGLVLEMKSKACNGKGICRSLSTVTIIRDRAATVGEKTVADSSFLMIVPTLNMVS
jgi:hypothetical protein